MALRRDVMRRREVVAGLSAAAPNLRVLAELPWTANGW